MSDTALHRRRLRRVSRWAATIACAAGLIPLFAGAAAASGGSAPASGADDETPQLSRASFEAPGAGLRPKFRWWWPLAQEDNAEIAREVHAMAQAGAGGAEIVGFPVPGVDPLKYGWGTDAWRDRLRTALTAARDEGLELDLTFGPRWPIASQLVTDPNDPAASKYVTYGKALVNGGAVFSGEVPVPRLAAAPGARSTLIAVVAARCVTTCSSDKPVLLDPSSIEDISRSVHGTTVRWTAPRHGQWLLFGFWQRPTGQVIEGAGPTPAYVVDHFSRAGAKAVTDVWDRQILTPELRRLLRQAGGSMFGDSLELTFSPPFPPDPTASGILWTAELPQEYRRLTGRSLAKDLPVMFVGSLQSWSPALALSPDSPADFDFAGDAGKRLRNDLYEAQTRLHVRNHLDPLRHWANALGLDLRYQPTYGSIMDMGEAAEAIDIPETEFLAFGDSVNRYRTLSGATHLAGKTVFSTECCPSLPPLTAGDGAYGQTWSQMLSAINRSYSGGVNQVVYHGFAYAEAPGSPWPGWSAFGQGFSENWGPRQPTWTHMPDINDYLARQQLVLRQGRPQVDVAVYRESYWEAGPSTPPAGLFTAPNLSEQGYTFEYFGPASIDNRLMKVRRGRLAPDGPAYKAVVLDRQVRISLNAARALLGFARSGLPIVVVGDAPSTTSGTDDRDRELRQVVRELLNQRSVRRVAAEADVAAALGRAGVRADVEHAAATGLWSVHRVSDRADFYYLFNDSATAVEQTVTVQGDAGGRFGGQPYRLDAWTGKIARVGEFQQHGTRFAIPVRLAPHDTLVLALGRDGWHRGLHKPGLHAISTDADKVIVRRGGRLLARAGRPGTYGSRLSDGRHVSTTIADVPVPRTLSGWHLSVEDWQPGVSPTQTTKVPHELELPELKTWPDIPELQDASGIGRYRTTLRLGAAWTGGYGAYLDVGAVFDTFRVTVNGITIRAADQASHAVDVGSYLKSGENTIEVEVATTLRNRLRTLDATQATRPRQPYGLTGPVRLVPYGEALLKTR